MPQVLCRECVTELMQEIMLTVSPSEHLFPMLGYPESKMLPLRPSGLVRQYTLQVRENAHAMMKVFRSQPGRNRPNIGGWRDFLCGLTRFGLFVRC